MKCRSLAPPPPDLNAMSRGDIQFLHPRYAAPHNILFRLARVESVDGTICGVHHRTGLLACQIVAGNVCDTGCLTTDKEGNNRESTPLGDILTDEEYYFVIDGSGKYESF